MKKNRILAIITVSLLFSFAACQTDTTSVKESADTSVFKQTETPATSTPTPTVHIHAFGEWNSIKVTCTEDTLQTRTCPCSETEQQTIPAPGHIIEYASAENSEARYCPACGTVFFGEQEIFFPQGTITKEDSTLQTNHLELHIPQNVYVMDNLAENLDIITSVMEEVSGMKFEGNPRYIKGLTQVNVEKPEDNEFGSAYAAYDGATISSGDILDLFALIHECSHVLHYNQSNWHFCQWAMEGISTYTTYKTQKYLEEYYPALTEFAGPTINSFANYEIYDYEKLYEHSMEYWIDNTFEYSGNINYSIGFRFMWYLDATYGDYTKWIYAYEESNPYYKANTGTDQVPSEVQPDVFKSVYGENVFEDFYAWLKENEHLFEMTRCVLDYTDATPFNLYPRCYWYGDDFRCIGLSVYSAISYNDLYIGLDAGKKYLTDYIGRAPAHLQLTINGDVTINLYDATGQLLKTYEADKNLSIREIDVTDVSFVKLVGDGTLTNFSINTAN